MINLPQIDLSSLNTSNDGLFKEKKTLLPTHYPKGAIDFSFSAKNASVSHVWWEDIKLSDDFILDSLDLKSRTRVGGNWVRHPNIWWAPKV